MSNEIILLSKRIHDDAIKEFQLKSEYVNYTPTTFTLNVPKQQRKKVFAYVSVRKEVKIYVIHKEICPENASPHKNPDRYPDSHFIILKNEADYNNTVLDMIKASYATVFHYYE